MFAKKYTKIDFTFAKISLRKIEVINLIFLRNLYTQEESKSYEKNTGFVLKTILFLNIKEDKSSII
jgi:hypothetical protein